MESLTWQEVVVLDSLFDKFVFIKQATNGFADAGIANDEVILPSDAGPFACLLKTSAFH